MPEPPRIAPLTVVTGHYGCGKTNLALNLAMDLAATGQPVTLVDLDIVNPYFRSSEHAEMLEARGVQVIAPTFAGTTLDVPSLPASIGSAFGREGAVIFDVGGDDAGATALGRFAADVAARDHDVLYVVNLYRNLTGTADEAIELLAEIEQASHLRATAIVNNSHLQRETTLETVQRSMPYAREVAAHTGLPLLCTTVPLELAAALPDDPGAAGYVEAAYPIKAYVRTPWEDGPAEG